MGWSDFGKVKKIGEGSFGKAWLVKNHKDQINYVIKEINISRMSVKERDEARKEVAVLAQMKHPNIVSYIDSFEEIGNLCIVMDYCDGGDLYSRITSQRGINFNEDQILDWFVQITLALKHVHDRKILHRDLKSQNIFLTKDGVIKLGDFGVAKILANTMELARTAIGTPYYMSPEICESKPYNNKSDVWSLGCVLYELTNLKHPFEAHDVKNLIMKILRGTFEPLRAIYSYDLRNLVASMLKRDPRERPSVNGILRKAFIMKRCQKFLTNEKLNEEFSHTVLHGEKIAKKLLPKARATPPPPPSRPISAAGASPIIRASPSNMIGAVGGVKPVYDPGRIYKNPLLPAKRKSFEKKVVANSPDIKKKPEINPSKRPISAIDQQRKKSQEDLLIPKKQIDNLLEKQKQERINKARECGWQNVLSNSYENNNQIKEEIIEDEVNKFKVLSPAADVPSYHHYYQQMEQAKKDKGGPMKAPVISKSPSKNANPLINDYLERKAAAARNKARGFACNYLPNKPPTPVLNIPKKNIQENLLVTLNKVRMQNLNKKIEKGPISNARSDEEMRENRLKQIADLKKQSEEQARKLHRELEKQRFEAFQKDQQVWKNHIEEKGFKRVANVGNNKGVYRPPPPATPIMTPWKPEVPVNMTEALKAIGISNETKNKNIKQIKEDILKNLNQRKGWLEATDLHSLEQKTLAQDDSSKRKAWDNPHESIIKGFELESLKVDTNTIVVPQVQQVNNETFIVHNKNNKIKIDDDEDDEFSIGALLDVTLGQFDLINTKLLRTCSEPDLNKLFPICEEESKDDSIVAKDYSNEKVVKTEGTLNKNHKLAKSLEDLKIGSKIIDLNVSKIKITDSLINKLIETSSSQQLENNQTYFGDFEDDDDIDEDDEDDDDVNGVIETMKDLLKSEDNEESEDPRAKTIRPPPKKKAESIEVKEISLNKGEEEDDSESLSLTLNGSDSSSDTEFEDDLMQIPKIQDQFHLLEEKREVLEKQLGTEKFIQVYKSIENFTNENSSLAKIKNDCELYRHILPDDKQHLYDEIVQLVVSDNVYKH